jgi:hypothetical protein
LEAIKHEDSLAQVVVRQLQRRVQTTVIVPRAVTCAARITALTAKFADITAWPVAGKRLEDKTT